MSEIATPRFALPFLAVGQAGKELTHNEALVLLDMLAHPVVEGLAAAPPDAAERAEGLAWLIDGLQVGDWAAAGPGDIAFWTSGGWRFLRPERHMSVVRRGDGARLRFDGVEWTQPPQLTLPVGGGTSDDAARASIGAIVSLLHSCGLAR